ncbi:hypothetical protein BV20DRAFT_566 [Pilatotrama ljubarskyi]|nr:hypothetical protein BV20DRAFT_566 [Pilatotrama ljubarskyi]
MHVPAERSSLGPGHIVDVVPTAGSCSRQKKIAFACRFPRSPFLGSQQPSSVVYVRSVWQSWHLTRDAVLAFHPISPMKGLRPAVCLLSTVLVRHRIHGRCTPGPVRGSGS